MVAVVLTLVVAFLLGATVWLTAGPQLKLNVDDEVNEVLNLVAYVAIALVPVFLGVFFLLDRN